MDISGEWTQRDWPTKDTQCAINMETNYVAT